MRFAPGTDPEVIRRAEEVFYGKGRQNQPMQAAPSAQQALPQPQMPPELQRLQEMSNALQIRMQSDPSMRRFQQQQRQLYSSIQQKTQNYVNSLQQFLNTAPPEFRQFLSSPQTLSRLGMAYQEQLPETQQIQNISREMSQYQQNTYGQEIQKIQQFEVQAAPKIAKYNYSRYLFDRQQQQAVGQPIQGQPVQAQQINLTQQQAFDNAQAAAIKKANEEFKERVSRPVQPPQQDPIVDPKRPTTTVPKTITPIERPPVQPIVDPKREPKPSGPRKLTPIKLERSPIQPIVDPKREPFKPPKAIKPIIPKPIQPTVDPKKEPFKPPKAIKPKGLGNRPKNPNVPSAFQGINTNINKQRQDMR